MACINRELKAIYIHLPKVGGLYIENILISFYNFKQIRFGRLDHDEFNENKNITKFSEINAKEESILQLRNKGLTRYFDSAESPITKEEWDTYYKFTFVRNPYDRMVSAFKYLNKINKINIHTNNFKDFIFENTHLSDYVYFHTFISQYDHLIDNNSNININYIGKFENLNEDFITVLRIIGISEIKHTKYLEDNIIINSSSQGKMHYDKTDKIKKNEKETLYTNYYDEECLQRINNYFKKDFERFNFKMCKNREELMEDSKKYILTNEQFIEKNQKILQEINKNITISKINKKSKILTEQESNELIYLNKNSQYTQRFNNFITQLSINFKPLNK
jgi:hypothetical protein